MKNNQYMLNTLLTAGLGVILLIVVVGRALFPVMILPEADIPNLVLISLIALVLDHYLAPEAKRSCRQGIRFLQRCEFVYGCPVLRGHFPVIEMKNRHPTSSDDGFLY